MVQSLWKAIWLVFITISHTHTFGSAISHLRIYPTDILYIYIYICRIVYCSKIIFLKKKYLSKWCCCSVTQLCLTPSDPMDCSMPISLSFSISWNLVKLMSIESVMPSNHLILCRPLLFLPSIFPSIRVFSNESVFFTSSGQSIGASASASVLPINIQD